MSLSKEWENNTEVMTPTGHTGKVRVTRRERQLIDDGKKIDVDVLGTDGLIRNFDISQLEKIEPESLYSDECCVRDENE